MEHRRREPLPGRGCSPARWTLRSPKTVLADEPADQGVPDRPGPAYGDPSLTQTCRLPDGTQRVRHAGLFGQTWLTCEVSAPAPAEVAEVSDRSERWCVEVANTLNTSR